MSQVVVSAMSSPPVCWWFEMIRDDSSCAVFQSLVVWEYGFLSFRISVDHQLAKWGHSSPTGRLEIPFWSGIGSHDWFSPKKSSLSFPFASERNHKNFLFQETISCRFCFFKALEPLYLCRQSNMKFSEKEFPNHSCRCRCRSPRSFSEESILLH